jgi:hypothetical protein
LKTSSDGLDTTYTHTASWDRMSARALPDANTWTYSYWGDTDQLGVSVCGLATSTVQSGLLHRRVGPDPDGVGAAKRRVEEFAYDRYGHQIASRVGLEGASPGTLDAGVAWTCVTLDGRWRTTHTTYPAFGGAPARTVW